MPSSNNNFTARATLNAAPSQSTVDPTGNTREAGEPTTFGATDGTAWWEYVPAAAGTATFTTEASDGDTVLGVFVRADASQPIAVTNLAAVASNRGGAADGQAKVSVAATAGTSYYLQVGSFTSSVPGTYRLSVFAGDLGYVRVAHDFAAAVVDSRSAVRVAHAFAAAVVNPRALHPPLRLRRRGDDNVTGSPRLPRFADSVQRTARVHGYR